MTMRRMHAFTLVEVIVASTAAVVVLVALTGIFQIALTRSSVQISYGTCVQEADVILDKVQTDARNAISFSTSVVNGNTLYIFTLPANRDVSGNYIPQQNGGSFQYVAGQQVAYYRSNINGSTRTRNGTILWRATKALGSNRWVTDVAWSRASRTVGRCQNIVSFTATTASMPANTVQLSFSVKDTETHITKNYTATREIFLSNHN